MSNDAYLFSLSSEQERLWILEQIEPWNTAYNVPIRLAMKGKVDPEILQKSVRVIVLRHEALRTLFGIHEGKPMQMVVSSMDIELSVMDFSLLTKEQRTERVQQEMQKLVQYSFNLSKGPLFLCRLLKLEEGQYELMMNFHHIIIDQWSIKIFFRELKELYEAELEGREAQLEELPIQYGDYAVWQRGWLHGETLNRLVEYWREKLDGIQDLELPIDRARPVEQTFQGFTCAVQLDQELTKALKELARAQGVTVNMLMLAIFNILLYRHTHQEDIVVGMPIAHRNRIELENLIGFFLNTLVIRINVSGESTFEELLHHVKQTLSDAYEYQDLPFEKLVEVLNPDRDLSRSPLFQVMFVMQDRPWGVEKIGEATIQPLRIETGTAKFDLTIFVGETGEQFEIALEYNTDLFDADRIERMVEHYKQLLTDVVRHPEKKIWELELLTESERHRILMEWNNTAVDYPMDKCIHELFQEQAERTPEAVAVTFGEQQLTYRELNERANQLGHYLQKLGVGPEVLVGICVERSIEMIVGLLGILKAGGAYVPLDPSYPEERLNFMLDDTHAPVFLTQRGVERGLNLGWENRKLIFLDDWESMKQEPTDNVNSGIQPVNLLYVIYTSGSTGRPKGILLQHLVLLNLILWQLEYSRPWPKVKVIQFSPLSFDVSCQEIFYTLLSGGELILISDYTRKYDLLDYIAQNHIEVLFLPFVALQQLASEANRFPHTALNLKEIYTAGEQLRADDTIIEFFARMKQCKLFNQYGPSETHVVTCYPLPIDPTKWTSLPPIGQPVSNVSIYILDKHQTPVPVGVVGELYIGGTQVSRGYLNRPEISHEHFLRDQFVNTGKTKVMYRTGDMARWLSDGNVEFLGRIDNQVKIRGYRIELGEIEAVLSQCEGIRAVIVDAREDLSGNRQLVAYYIPGEEHLKVEQLRSFASGKLPYYMVPSVFMAIEKIPLTSSGKVDRRALPIVKNPVQASHPILVQAETNIEKSLTLIWKHILNIQEISIYDNFFSLGGNSLGVIKMANYIKTYFGINIPLKSIFATPTILQLASYLTSNSPLTPQTKKTAD